MAPSGAGRVRRRAPQVNGSLDIHPKVAGATLSAALGIVVVWLLTLAHVEVTPEAAAAIPAVLAGFGGWLAPLRDGK